MDDHHDHHDHHETELPTPGSRPLRPPVIALTLLAAILVAVTLWIAPGPAADPGPANAPEAITPEATATPEPSSSAATDTTTLATPSLPPATGFDPGHAPFRVRLGEETIPYRVFGVYVLPDERVELTVAPARDDRPEALADDLTDALTEDRAGDRARDGADRGAFRADASGGRLARLDRHTWSWDAPDRPGVEQLVITGPDGATVTLNAFVLVPRTEVEGGWLNGYRIGDYPDKPLRGLPAYKPPRGFVEVTPAMAHIQVSPHFTLGQFLCKQRGGFPKYLILRERLLHKLEVLLEAVNRAGVPADSFAVLSGFRTPTYNAAIGNVRYSRHQWGDAADIFVDENGDGVMDDIDGDGRLNKDDARFLYRLVEDLRQEPEWNDFVGGAGLYGVTSTHGAFLHVDTRGYRARWGL